MPDDDERPAAPQEREALLDGPGGACGCDRHVSAAGERAHGGDWIGANGRPRPPSRRTPRGGELLLGDVDRDHGIGSGERGPLDGVQPDTARPDHRHRLARADAPGPLCGADAGQDRAAQDATGSRPGGAAAPAQPATRARPPPLRTPRTAAPGTIGPPPARLIGERSSSGNVALAQRRLARRRSGRTPRSAGRGSPRRAGPARNAETPAPVSATSPHASCPSTAGRLPPQAPAA